MTVLPVQHRRRKVPIEYKDESEKELGEMVWQGIIAKQTEPTPWVSSLIYPKKANGKLRICLDPKGLNKAIIRENHKAPTLEEIAHILTGATKFSKVDGNKAFFGMHLTKEASLLTFNTHLGWYRFLWVQFGLKMSQDIFQMRMDDIMPQCPGVLAIHDDIFIYGKDDRDHDANIINLFNIAQKEGLVFNSVKCSIKQESVTFFEVYFQWKATHQIQQRYKESQRWHPLRQNKSYSHFWEQSITCKPLCPIWAITQNHYEQSWKKRTALPGTRTQTTVSRK